LTINLVAECNSTAAGDRITSDGSRDAGTYELLSRNHWHGVRLADIIRRELAPYGTTNTDISGAGVTLKAGCICSQPLLWSFSDACMTTLSARADGRRPKSTNGRN